MKSLPTCAGRMSRWLRQLYRTFAFSICCKPHGSMMPGKELQKKIEEMLPKNEHPYGKEDFERDVKTFERGEHSLYNFLTNDVVFSSVQLILSDFRKVTFPYLAMAATLDGFRQQNIEVTDFVIDPLSLVLFAYLSKKHGLTYSRKFVIPKSEQELFAQSLNNYLRYPSNVNPICFWGIVPQEIDKALGDDYGDVLRYLNDWIGKNCKVEYVSERMARADGGHIETISLDRLADCLMLAHKPYNVLITEDSAIHSLLKGMSFVAICGETYLSYYEGRGVDMEKMLLERNYVVSQIDADTLFEKYEKDSHGQKSRYDTCKMTMARHPEMWQEIMQFIGKVLNKGILQQRDMDEVKSCLYRLIVIMGAKRNLLLSHFMLRHQFEIALQQQFAQLFQEACANVEEGWIL